MRIALVSDSIYPFNKGGKETRSYELAKNLSQKNNEVHFYTMNFWDKKEPIKKQGFYLHGLCKDYPLYTDKRRSIKQGIIFGFGAFKLLREDFDVVDADHMVYFHLFPIKLACLIKRKPMVITWHEVWGKDYWIEYMGRKGIFGNWIEKIASKLPNKIIAVSENTKKQLIEKLNVSPKKIFVIPNAIEFQKIQKIKPSKEKSDIIYAGRLLSHKNIDKLIRAVSILKKKNPKIKCIIIGDGPEKENLIKLTKKLNLTKNIVFKGIIESSKDVLSLIKASKVFVLPSTREGFGITVIEANACGIPVITVDHKDNAARHLVKNPDNGLVIDLNDRSLAEGIKIALKRYKAIKGNCLSSAEKYNWKNIIKRFSEVYRR